MRKFTTLIFTATFGAAILVATATPGFAQAYCACWGTGNMSDTPLLEKTNGAYGWAMSVPPQGGAAASAYAAAGSAYAAAGSSSRHSKHNRRHGHHTHQ
jgi:hypothetical protein